MSLLIPDEPMFRQFFEHSEVLGLIEKHSNLNDCFVSEYGETLTRSYNTGALALRVLEHCKTLIDKAGSFKKNYIDLDLQLLPDYNQKGETISFLELFLLPHVAVQRRYSNAFIEKKIRSYRGCDTILFQSPSLTSWVDNLSRYVLTVLDSQHRIGIGAVTAYILAKGNIQEMIETLSKTHVCVFTYPVENELVACRYFNALQRERRNVNTDQLAEALRIDDNILARSVSSWMKKVDLTNENKTYGKTDSKYTLKLQLIARLWAFGYGFNGSKKYRKSEIEEMLQKGETPNTEAVEHALKVIKEIYSPTDDSNITIGGYALCALVRLFSSIRELYKNDELKKAFFQYLLIKRNKLQQENENDKLPTMTTLFCANAHNKQETVGAGNILEEFVKFLNDKYEDLAKEFKNELISSAITSDTRLSYSTRLLEAETA